MSLIEGNNIIPGTLGPYWSATVPDGGTAPVQTLTFSHVDEDGERWGSGDEFTLRYGGEVTDGISWSATNGTLAGNIQTALRALDNPDLDGVTVVAGTATAGIGDFTVTLANKRPALALSVESVTAEAAEAELSASVTTEGASPEVVGALKGALLIVTDTPELRQNTGTPEAPVWTKISA